MSARISDNSMCCEGNKQVSGEGATLEVVVREAGPLGTVRMVSRCPLQGELESPHSKQTVSKLSVSVGCSRKKKEWGAVTKTPTSNGIPQ